MLWAIRNRRALFLVSVLALCSMPPWRGPADSYGVSTVKLKPLWQPWGHVALDVLFLEIAVAAAMTFGVAWFARRAERTAEVAG